MTKNPKENQMKAPTITSNHGLKDCVNLSPEHAASRIILETAVQGDKVMQDFNSESFVMVGDHSQTVKAPTITNDYGLKDCVNLSPSTDVSRIIIGIDPGTTVTGYGIIQVRHPTITALDYGCIRPPAKMKLSDRYLIIFESIEQLLEKYKPDALVVETQYMAGNAHSRNVRGTLKLGMACGISILAAKRKGISVYEYTPTKAKKAVVGKGSASKDQVGAMVQRLLNLSLPPYPQDASDALSLAICHAQSCRVAGICKNEI